MDVAWCHGTNDIKQLACLDTYRSRLDDLGLGVASNGAVQIGTDDPYLILPQ
jgi:hypothetical protein